MSGRTCAHGITFPISMAPLSFVIASYDKDGHFERIGFHLDFGRGKERVGLRPTVGFPGKPTSTAGAGPAENTSAETHTDLRLT